MEGKGIISSNQAGFRKRMETMDQIYTLNYLINRQLGEGRYDSIIYRFKGSVRLDR